MTWKSILLGLCFIVFFNCSSSQKRTCIRKIHYSCICNTLEAKQIGMVRLLDNELEIYKIKKKIVFSPEIEDEIFQVPSTYLENFYFQEKPNPNSISSPKQERSFIVKGNLNEQKLENYLETQDLKVVKDQKVYSKKGRGERGLELILNYSKERQKQKSIDKDKYYKDRIDMLKRIKE